MAQLKPEINIKNNRMAFAKLISAAIQILLPSSCPGCRRPTGNILSLCVDCWAEISWITDPVCAVSGVPLSYDLGADAISPTILEKPPDYDWARSACFYDGVVAQLIRQMKFSDHPEFAYMMSRWLLRFIFSLEAENAPIIFMPVPLHIRRLRMRRYNQVSIVARELARLTGHQYAPNLLRRGRATKPQTGLSSVQRAKNVRDAFFVPEALRQECVGRHIILVDDVMTTGATVNACSKALKAAGAAWVGVVTIGRVC